MAKLILTHEVTGLGQPGDVVEVKDGYARNYLVPRGLATRWTKNAQKQVDQMTSARQARAIASIEDAQVVRDRLQSGPVTIAVKAGESGRLFGAVSSADIASAVAAAGGPEVDRRKIEIASPIKAVGEYRVQVRLHEDVSASLVVDVVAGD